MPSQRRSDAGPCWIVLASRLGHGLISLLFLCCIGALYLGAWRGQAGTLTLAALSALVVEGVLVIASGGDCPLGPALRRLGDDTPFFELFLPARADRVGGLAELVGRGQIALFPVDADEVVQETRE